MVWLLNSQGTKHCKSKESFSLSILFTQMIDPLTFWRLLLPCTFFLTIFLSMCKPRTTSYLICQFSPPGLVFYGSGPANVSMMSIWEWWVQADLVPCHQKCSCKWNKWFFRAFRPSRLPFYIGSPLHIILIKPHLLVPEYYFA